MAFHVGMVSVDKLLLSLGQRPRLFPLLAHQPRQLVALTGPPTTPILGCDLTPPNLTLAPSHNTSNYTHEISCRPSTRAPRERASVCVMAQAPVVAGEETKILPVRLNQSLADQLAATASERGIPRSQLMREVLRDYLEREVAAS